MKKPSWHPLLVILFLLTLVQAGLDSSENKEGDLLDPERLSPKECLDLVQDKYKISNNKIPYCNDFDIPMRIRNYSKNGVTLKKSDLLKDQNQLVLEVPAKKGEIIFICTGWPSTFQDRYSIQVDYLDDKSNYHIQSLGLIAFLNHKCTPMQSSNQVNHSPPIILRMNKNNDGTYSVIAFCNKNISIDQIERNGGIELTFDYAANEITLSYAEGIKCLCDAPKKHCRKQILGFNGLSRKEQEFLVNTGIASDHVKKYFLEVVLSDNYL
ncbi:hypothetical protein [Candidatus Neptunochlamydia vexilliferae]|nr:hypothetical protein [Candidatus Neptunochlamydia vexilliferae]